MSEAHSDDRQQLAEGLLQEAVFSARARQAAGVATSESASASCGLGPEIRFDLDLSERGAELFRELWPRDTSRTEVDRIKTILERWVSQQDAFDRKRNHFLRDFRQQHGFDRREYTAAQADEFENGLAHVNTEIELRLKVAAGELLDA